MTVFEAESESFSCRWLVTEVPQYANSNFKLPKLTMRFSLLPLAFGLATAAIQGNVHLVAEGGLLEERTFGLLEQIVGEITKGGLGGLEAKKIAFLCHLTEKADGITGFIGGLKLEDHWKKKLEFLLHTKCKVSIAEDKCVPNHILIGSRGKPLNHRHHRPQLLLPHHHHHRHCRHRHHHHHHHHHQLPLLHQRRQALLQKRQPRLHRP